MQGRNQLIFSGAYNDCILLLYLTTTHFFEILGEASGVARLSAALSTSQICLQEFKMKEIVLRAYLKT